jgi:hypothetical protein
MPLSLVGRPSSYTPEIGARVCELIESGQSLLDIESRDDMPSHPTVAKWLADFPDFAAGYARARRIYIDRMGDEILAISDDARNDWMDRQQGEDTVRVVDHEHVTRSKLRVDTRKWVLSKLRPDQYGDRVAHQMLDEHGKPAKAGITIIVDGAPSGSGE